MVVSARPERLVRDPGVADRGNEPERGEHIDRTEFVIREVDRLGTVVGQWIVRIHMIVRRRHPMEEGDHATPARAVDQCAGFAFDLHVRHGRTPV